MIFITGLLMAIAALLPLTAASRTGPSKKLTSTKQSFVRSKAPAKKPAATRNTKAKAPTFRRIFYSPWKEPTYKDSTDGDQIDGEDLVVRRAAVEALGPLNGTVVVVDPQTGRVLTVVNQKVAFRPGFTPCSTIKIMVGLAGLSEGVIERETQIKISRRMSLNLTEALAKSENSFFQRVGNKLGFERVSYYHRLFGLGEKATLGFEGEKQGTLPLAPPPDGVGYMSSHGHGIVMSPLQLASTMTAIANGGTLYYLQYPQTQEEAANLVPRIKRHLDIQQYLPDVKPGLMAAVDHGTARRAGFDPDEPILGKTGTCTDQSTPTHLGWFASFNDVDKNKLVVIVLLTGGRPINGPVASGVGGKIYRTLSEQRYFDQERPISPVALLGSRPCCVE